MNFDDFFRLCILVLVVAMFAVSITFRRRANRRGGESVDRTREGRPLMIALRVVGFGAWLCVLVYVVNPAWIAIAEMPLPEWTRWLGLALSAAAVPLLIWMFRSLGDNITDTVVTRAKAQLVTRGPYRYIRHPLYSFGALFFVGVVLMSANALILVLGASALALLALRTPNEEARLIDKFGDEYRSYIQRTGRFVPRLS